MMFFTMLFMYSAFVLTSIGTEYYVQDIARVFEYYVYFWGAGDLIEELISCFVSLPYKPFLKEVLMNIKNANQFNKCKLLII